MAFQLKDFVSIVAGMVNHFRGVQTEVTDFNIGGVARTMLEAPAIEMDELYQRTFDGIRQAIPVATYNSFNFERLPAKVATGVITVTITAQAAAVLIQAGTVFTFTGGATRYISLNDTTIAIAGTTAQIAVAAETPGLLGNIAAGKAFSPAPSITGFVSATNAASFVNAADQETDAERKQRFTLYISTLQRGTVAALNYGAKLSALLDVNGNETERVKASSVVEDYVVNPSNPAGNLTIYIHNGVGSTSDPLVTRCQAVIDGYTDSTTGEKIAGWKAAGVKATVAKATEVGINMTPVVTAEPGYNSTTLAATANTVIRDYILSLDIGQSYLIGEATWRVMNIPGVLNVTGMASTTTATTSQKLVPGTITVTGA